MRAFTKAAALVAAVSLAVFATILSPIAAFALEASSSIAATADTSVHLAWGDIIGQLGADFLPWAGLALLGVVTSLLPAPVKALVARFRTQQLDQLLERALGFAAAKLQDRLKGQEVSVDLHNALVAQATQFAIDHGSKAVLDFAGQNAIPEKLTARVLTSPAVQAAKGQVSPAFPSAAAK